MSTILFAEVVVVFEDVVNSDNLPHVAVCPFVVELLGLEQFVHVLQSCFDWKRGVNPCAACVDVLACKLRVSACLEHYLPECLSFSHNLKQSITIFSKSQLFFSTFLPFHNSEPFTLYAPIQWRVTCPLFQGNLFDCPHSINPRPHDLNRFFFHILISHNLKQSNTVNPKCQLKNHLFFQLFSRCHYS